MSTNYFDLAADLARAEARGVTTRVAVAVRHYVRWDEPSKSSQRLQKTVCRIWVSPAAVGPETDVTCKDCLSQLAAEVAESDNPEDVFGPSPDPSSIPPVRPFDALAGYRPKGTR